ncbi:DNA-binding transcriptional LysR family regulator [Novosphingobium chloroacetimidivorans]|uniref:DNA-binding transcriptional LysR family regulator n=1 Tax=Novosphingobium chloroacetimidivorans TaxID=1428314 RepID=A0A7W7NYC3_9SPHN|nr:LysR family transcriptional regulator [Novosphingobium chloroacetimidivorans]MBB4860314.1 DNA-binding transcriptional LysR family regulator [Novosphingobium chloroacetimidivorans]
MLIEPRHFRVLLAVIEHGTFNRAAEALSVSQPAISKAIAQLERSLGARLFERGKQGSTPTAAGLIAARSATNIDWAMRHAQEEIRASAHNLVGPLVIGTTPSMLFGLLPRALSFLGKACPNASIIIRDGLDDLLLEALDKGEIELLVGPIDSLRPASDRIVQNTVAQEPLLLAVPHGHRLSERDELHVSELSDEPWILPIKGSSFYRIVEALFRTADQRLPANAFHMNSLVLQEQLVTRTGRLCFVTPAQFIDRTPPFKIVRLADAPVRSIGVRHRADLSLSPMATQFIESVRETTQAIEREFLAIAATGQG